MPDARNTDTGASGLAAPFFRVVTDTAGTPAEGPFPVPGSPSDPSASWEA